MAQLPAYAVDGGQVPAAMARRVTYAVSSGANGIVAVGDLKVTQLPTPAGGVVVSRGGALCRQRTTGANEFETYAIAQDSSTNVTVTATGGDGRTDYLIARVMDWHFTGNPAPADPANALYWEFALVSTLTGISTPYVALAKITLPANTSAVTNAMITDLREVAIPRKERTIFTYAISAGQEDTLSTTESWPDLGGFPITVPAWATLVNVAITFAQVKVPAGSTRTGFLNAMLSVNGQTKQTPTTAYDGSAPPSLTRQTFVAAGQTTVPSAMRGYSGIIYTRGTTSGGAGDLVLDSNSAVIIDIEFIERAE